MIGTRIGPYELRGELAEGGMGRVFRAFHPGDKLPCALKVLAPSASLTDDNVARFVDEARLAARVGSHPNLVQVYDAGRDEQGFVWMAMELIEGTTLLEKIERGHADPRESARLLAQVCSALAHVHQHHIVHRDLKPSNVLIDEHGNAKLSDFGIAKSRVRDASLTTTGSFLGTPWFMAPEQAEDPRNADSRSDIYGVGAVLYMVLTGRPPHQGPSALAVIAKIMEEDPAPPRTLVPDVDRRLEAVCLKALSRDPAERYPDATALKAALEEAIDPARAPAAGAPLGAPGSTKPRPGKAGSSGKRPAMRRSGLAPGYRSSAERPGYRTKESNLLMPLLAGLGLLTLLGLSTLIFALGAADEPDSDGSNAAYSGVAPILSYVLPRPNAVLGSTVRIKGVVSPPDAPVVISMLPADSKTPTPDPVRTRAVGGAFSGRFKLSHGKWKLHLVGGGGDNTVVLAERSFLVDARAPELRLKEPPKKVSRSGLLVEGTCWDDGEVKELTINGLAVSLGSDGRFSHEVKLTPGANAVTVKATDGLGQATSRRFVVAYRK